MIRTPRNEPAFHTSLGLQALCRRIQDVGACDILELGPVRNRNLDFWSRFQPSIYIADLRSSLPLPDSGAAEEAEPEPDWGQILGLPERTYNVILAWDLLNYLDISSVSSLARHLARFCGPEALLFAMIYDQKQMPDQITVYKIADESHLEYENGSTATRLCPRHQPRTLAAAMPGFSPDESFRMKNGIVEYLFRYAP